MTSLAQAQRKQLRQQLEALAERLRAEVAAHRTLPNHREETDDDAVASLESDLDVAELERDARELEAVVAALARVGTPAYGMCVDCGVDISFMRLSANPAAARCLECQQRREG